MGYFAIRPALGNLDQVILQFKGVAFVGIYAFVCTLVLGYIIHKTIGFTVSEAEQDEGIDFIEHGETAYRLG